MARPERGVVYELTEYGRELEAILMALGRWGTRSMGRLPAQVATRSRWLVAAMLAFDHGGDRPATGVTIELRLDDGAFTVSADAGEFAVRAGAPPDADADAVITVSDQHLHQLLTGRLDAQAALASGVIVVDGDPDALRWLIARCGFPALNPVASG
jgi:hypothetical protein